MYLIFLVVPLGEDFCVNLSTKSFCILECLAFAILLYLLGQLRYVVMSALSRKASD